MTKKRSTPSKATGKKQSTKKRTVRKKKKKSSFKKGLVFLLVLFVMVSLVAFGYYLGQQDKVSSGAKSTQKVSHKKAEHHKKISRVFSNIKTKKPVKAKTDAPVKKEQLSAVSESKEKVALACRAKKPKLVIIIDDVSKQRQLNRIRALKIPVTPSIFPPSHLSMSSHTLARGLKHYMIHLPMESGSRQFNKQYKTLRTSFSKAQMEARMKEIRRLFPTAVYINNHTGSVFTDDYQAMHTLYGIMKKEGFVFIDSRTIGSTKVRKIAHEYGDTYMARDIFIDNTQRIDYIHGQLKKAVRIAKKKGYAIAIGHPHKVTMQALSTAGNIFKDVEPVYIDQIFQK
ncbi:divergent polysaccharide deacetylase family protein [Sulfurovum lithotrophicum]|uniref:divergent polysaccharide deacetylase family protein n=1 Tax=Sulfurovum lithotrophicum TaxID=206403 RepID=UPI001FE0B664|nr:divergent polysaccharide deacetylase family protein [Sulfurovum lithotrophicum]